MGRRDDRRGSRDQRDTEYGQDQYGGGQRDRGRGGQQGYGQGGQGRGGQYGQGYDQGYDQQRPPQGGRQPGRHGGGYAAPPGQDTEVVGKRIAAHIIDNILILVSIFVALIVVGSSVQLGGSVSSTTGGAVGLLAILVVGGGVLFYLFLLEGYWDGQTVGKRAVSIRVVKEDGSRIGYAESVIRNLLEIVEGLFYYVPALIIILASDRNQRLGDHAASTIVVEDDPQPPRGQVPRSQQPPQQQGQGQQQWGQQEPRGRQQPARQHRGRQQPPQGQNQSDGYYEGQSDDYYQDQTDDYYQDDRDQRQR